MLTKDLLRYRKSSGYLRPKYLGADASISDVAKKISKIADDCVGKNIQYFNERCDDLEKDDFIDGLKKVVTQKFVYADSDVSVETERLKLFLAAQKLREECEFEDRGEFKSIFADAQGSTLEVLQETLYSDLPEFVKITGIRSSPEDLIQEYNIQLAKSFFLHAQILHLQIKKPSRDVLRYIVHKIKFHQLLFEVEESSAKILRISVSGPLSQSLKSKLYGKNLANFMGSLFVLSDWKCAAEVGLKNKNMSFKVSSKDPLKGTAKFHSGYAPLEYETVVDSFNQKSQKWKISFGATILNLGDKNYSCPDFVLEHQSTKNKIYVELFHSWHFSELPKKIRFLEKSAQKDYLIGIDKAILKKQGISDFWHTSAFVRRFGFEFRNFPTSKSLLSKVENLGSSS